MFLWIHNSRNWSDDFSWKVTFKLGLDTLGLDTLDLNSPSSDLKSGFGRMPHKTLFLECIDDEKESTGEKNACKSRKVPPLAFYYQA